MRRLSWTMLLITAALLTALPAFGPAARGDGLEDCIAATCRVRAPDGTTGSGFLYAVGPEKIGDEDLAWIGTVAHVVVSDRLTCEFGRARVRVDVRPYWLNRRIDAGVLVVPWRLVPTPRPRPIPVAPPQIRIKVGQALFSIGCPNGGELMLWRGVCKGYNGGALWFWPGPELGRSGSPMFCYLADGQPAVVGIVSARDSATLGPNTTGRAVSVQQLRGTVDTSLPTAQVWTPVQCPGGVCPAPLPLDDHYYISPYRQQEQRRNNQLQQRLESLERSQGTIPLPPPQSQERLETGPSEIPLINQRLTNLERAVVELQQHRERVIAVAEQVAQEVPVLRKAMDEVGAKAAQADQKAEAVAVVAEQNGKAAAEAKQAVQEATDEDNPRGIVGRLKVRIAEAKAEAVAEGKEGLAAVPVVAKDVAMGVLQSYGLPAGIAGLVLAFVVWDIRKKVTEGDPLLVEKVAARVHDRLGPVRERVIERVADVRQDIQQKIHPQQQKQP